MNITGKTDILLMLADPVDHIRGTVVINDAFAALDLDAVVAPLHIKPIDLQRCLDAVRIMHNVRGLGITIPHKIAAVALMDDLTEAARQLGAVNFVRRNADGSLTGTNTDGAGFIAGLVANGVDIKGSRALVVGTGGVGRAIVIAMAAAGLSSIALANRDRSKAEALAGKIRKAYPECRVTVTDASSPGCLEEIDLLVNGTSLGMKDGDTLPVNIDRLAAGTVVAEVIVNPSETPLLAAAAERGCKTIAGAEMLKPQPSLVATFLGLGAPA